MDAKVEVRVFTDRRAVFEVTVHWGAVPGTSRHAVSTTSLSYS
jgi:hypothetical protein